MSYSACAKGSQTRRRRLSLDASGQQRVKEPGADAKAGVRRAEVVRKVRRAQRAQPAAPPAAVVQAVVHTVVGQVAAQDARKGRRRQGLP